MIICGNRLVSIASLFLICSILQAQSLKELTYGFLNDTIHRTDFSPFELIPEGSSEYSYTDHQGNHISLKNYTDEYHIYTTPPELNITFAEIYYKNKQLRTKIIILYNRIWTGRPIVYDENGRFKERLYFDANYALSFDDLYYKILTEFGQNIYLKSSGIEIFAEPITRSRINLSDTKEYALYTIYIPSLVTNHPDRKLIIEVDDSTGHELGRMFVNENNEPLTN